MAKKSSPKPSKTVLAPLHVKLLEKPVKTGDVLTVMTEEDYPTQYNEAASITKATEEFMTDLKPAMLPLALSTLFQHNSEKPWEPIASVAFQDANANVTRISFTSKYKDTTAEVAEALFKSIRLRKQDNEEEGRTANVNDYMARTVTAEFDSTIFQGADGKFDKNRYDKIVGALEAVCAELNVKNPLSSKVVIKPLPSFHTRRWTDFDQATNVRLSTVLMNQMSFTPCPNAKTGKMAGAEEEEKNG